MTKQIINIGIDVGSTTVKLLLTDDKLNILYKNYERHFSDTKKVILKLLNEALTNYKNAFFRISLTGSGALSLSEYTNINFVQEVIACKNCILNLPQSVDVAIELGGEDAKIIYFTNGVEQRMNGSCAGGTGAFLDQMATLLNTDTTGLNELARKGEKIYPVASRCGVFAKTDIQPLLNEGAKKEDIALSIMQAVVNQTISGLACGKPIKGNVIFLGGPLNYLDTLRNRFIATLNLSSSEAIIPSQGHLFVCLGAIQSNLLSELITYKDLCSKIKLIENFKEEKSSSLEPLFKNDKEYKDFLKRHNKYKVEEIDLSTFKEDAFLGIDAGSTTAKLVLINKDGNLLYKDYRSNEGTPVDTVKSMLISMYKKLNKDIKIRTSGATGYGEELIKSVFNLDISEIETVAHFEGAKHFNKNVTSIIDIGGQDMKYIKIKNNAIDTIMLNEACSSGCGSFLESLSKSLNIPIDEFVSLAIKSKNPVDLGSRCTVFMNSKIKQTQKEGRPLGDIFAGLSYSIIKNALQKVMKVRDSETLGETIVVQGGTFLNDAVLRAFELISEKEVIRPNISSLMGAYGIALIGANNYQNYDNKKVTSNVLNLEELKNLEVKTTSARCGRCENKCALTVNSFRGKKYISGNRCERGSGNNGSDNLLPNMYKYKYDRLFNYEPIDNPARGEIGIPRVLNMYENYPFWHTFFSSLGFKVVLSDHSNKQMFLSGMNSIPSESVCYPAKLVHGHIINLINKNVRKIFLPCIIYEIKEFKKSDNCYNCPVVTSYPEAIKLNVEELKENNVEFLNPFLSLKKDALVKSILSLDEFKEYGFTKKELCLAVDNALLEQECFKKDIVKKSKEFIKYIKDHNERAVVLAGRPYHIDKEINHGIDTLINSLGLAVLTEDSICYEDDDEINLRIVDQWTYHARIYRAANVVCKSDFLELVNLNSFGCGIDAIIIDQLEEILKKNNKMLTTIKIDEINNLGAVKIRLRSLIASMKNNVKENNYTPYNYEKNLFTKDMKKNHTILVPDMSPYHMGLICEAAKGSGYNFVYLEHTSKEMVEQGLKYVHNDACYPAIIVIGQLIYALKTGNYDLKNTSVAITQTGGGCRATNYIGLIRKALKDAGFGHVPIISVNMSGLEKEQAFNLTIPMINRLFMAVTIGDLFLKLVHQTRPYEKTKGQTDKLYEELKQVAAKVCYKGSIVEYKKLVKKIVTSFNEIEIIDKDLVKVGVVGEILIKYHSFGNNNIVRQLEDENVEVVLPELMGFVKYCAYNNVIKFNILKEGKVVSFVSKKVLSIIDLYEGVVLNSLKDTRYRNLSNIYNLEKNVENILSTGNQTGEGWFLTAEIVELIKHGTHNVVCIQPFACLPNHIVGKSVIKKIKSVYKEANIIAIDYDPGASVSNQVNRIKLMLSIAQDAKIKENNK